MKITEILTEDWNRVNHHDHTNGLSQKAVNAYRREHPGSKLKTAVTTKPSKLKKGSKAAKRRKSFCARMSGNKGPMRKPNGKPTPKALALRRWHCESIEEMAALIEHAEQEIMQERLIQEKWTQKYKKSINCSHPKGFSQRAHCAGKKKHNEDVEMEHVCPDCGMCATHGDNLLEVRQRLDAKCWKGKHKEGTKIKGSVRVNNCVPNESVAYPADQVKKVFKDKAGNPVGEIGIDPESSPGNGEWYVHHYGTGYSVVGFDSAAEAKRELMYVHKHPEAVEGHESTFDKGVAEGVDLTPYEAGEADGLGGEYYDNPYPEGSKSYVEFRQGWRDGRKQAEANRDIDEATKVDPNAPFDYDVWAKSGKKPRQPGKAVKQLAQQTRDAQKKNQQGVAEGNPAQQAAIAIAKKKKARKTEGILPVGPVLAAMRMFNRQREAYELFTKKFPSQQAAEQWASKYNAELHNISPATPPAAKPIDLNPMVDQIKLAQKITPENFADGRHPEDKGDSKRLGVPTHASVSTLRKVAHQGGRKGQLAHWMANMKAGRAKKS